VRSVKVLFSIDECNTLYYKTAAFRAPKEWKNLACERVRLHRALLLCQHSWIKSLAIECVFGAVLLLFVERALTLVACSVAGLQQVSDELVWLGML